MTIAVINDDGRVKQWLQLQPDSKHDWCFVNETADLAVLKADFALVMQAPVNWIQQLEIPALVNETERTFQLLQCQHKQIARFCGWPTFFERRKWEVAVANTDQWLQNLAVAFDREFIIVADTPGLVAPRILAMIINEACHGLADGICSPQDMDTAMQLGTNYPMGPIAWMEVVGKSNIASLLTQLAIYNSRYTPHYLLQANQSA